MNMLRAIDLLKQDIKAKEDKYKIHMNDELFYNYGPLIPNRLIHIYGEPDCGKTTIAMDIIEENYLKSFVYINKNPDNIMKMKKFKNCTIFNSNVFETTLLYLKTLEPSLVDFVIIDDIQNMLSQEELNSAFSKRLDERELLNKYIKQLSIVAAQKKFNIIIFNGINGVTGKSRYGYIIEKEAIATFKIEKGYRTYDKLILKVIPEKNIMNDIKDIAVIEIPMKGRR